VGGLMNQSVEASVMFDQSGVVGLSPDPRLDLLPESL
jgi:hypothetical protein